MGNSAPIPAPPLPTATRAVLAVVPGRPRFYGALRFADPSHLALPPPPLRGTIPTSEYTSKISAASDRIGKYRGGIAAFVGLVLSSSLVIFFVTAFFFGWFWSSWLFASPLYLFGFAIAEVACLVAPGCYVRRESTHLVRDVEGMLLPWGAFGVRATMRRVDGTIPTLENGDNVVTVVGKRRRGIFFCIVLDATREEENGDAGSAATVRTSSSAEDQDVFQDEHLDERIDAA